jgi:hypothetical protein
LFKQAFWRRSGGHFHASVPDLNAHWSKAMFLGMIRTVRTGAPDCPKRCDLRLRRVTGPKAAKMPRIDGPEHASRDIAALAKKAGARY